MSVSEWQSVNDLGRKLGRSYPWIKKWAGTGKVVTCAKGVSYKLQVRPSESTVKRVMRYEYRAIQEDVATQREEEVAPAYRSKLMPRLPLTIEVCEPSGIEGDLLERLGRVEGRIKLLSKVAWDASREHSSRRVIDIEARLNAIEADLGELSMRSMKQEEELSLAIQRFSGEIDRLRGLVLSLHQHVISEPEGVVSKATAAVSQLLESFGRAK